MSIIQIEHVSKIYNHNMVPVTALQDINLEFGAGEFTAIVGPSGSGKTTLLNLIGGLDTATEGQVRIDGVLLSSLSSAQRIDFRLHNIGFVFQSYNLLPVLTARENVEFMLQMLGWPRAKRQQRLDEVFTSMALTNRMNDRPHQLSGGQQQRVAVARAIASGPKFILADEPTANLDSKSAGALLEVMAELNRQKQITFLFSTHDFRVMQKAHRIITIEDGRVVRDESQSV